MPVRRIFLTRTSPSSVSLLQFLPVDVTLDNGPSRIARFGKISKSTYVSELVTLIGYSIVILMEVPDLERQQGRCCELF